MKQFSTVLNIVLLVAVAVLYVLHFNSGKKTGSSASNPVKSASGSTAVVANTIAYIDLDSIHNNVEFIKLEKQQLEEEQKSMNSAYQQAYVQLEAERNNFLKKGNSITQKEAEEFSYKLQQRQQEIEADRQEKSKRLADKSAKVMEDLQSKLREFINEYNKDNRFNYILATGTGLDYIFYKDSTRNITPDVVKGLNEKHKVPGK